jgi:hypothetical protein
MTGALVFVNCIWEALHYVYSACQSLFDQGCLTLVLLTHPQVRGGDRGWPDAPCPGCQEGRALLWRVSTHGGEGTRGE